MLDHMLSIHVRSRVFATLEDAAQFIKSVSMLYEAYVETKKIASLKVYPIQAFLAFETLQAGIRKLAKSRIKVV